MLSKIAHSVLEGSYGVEHNTLSGPFCVSSPVAERLLSRTVIAIHDTLRARGGW